MNVLRSQDIRLNIEIRQAAHELAVSHAVSHTLNTGLLNRFSLANSLMDEISKQSIISKTLEEDLSKISNELAEKQADLVRTEEDRAMAKAMEQCIKTQMVTLNKRMAEQVATKRAAEHDALISQTQIHRMYDQLEDISAELDGRILEKARHAHTATAVAEDLYSAIMSLTHAMCAIGQKTRDPLDSTIQNNRGTVCARTLLDKCHSIPELGSIPVLEFFQGCQYAALEQIHLMESLIDTLRKYASLRARRTSLTALHDRILAQERILLLELKAAKTCLATKQREVGQKMLQEDLISIKAKNKAKELFNRIQESSQTMEKVNSDTQQTGHLQEEEATLRQHKVHLMRALRELRHTNTILLQKKKKKETSVRNQKLNVVALHEDSKTCQSHIQHMEKKLVETSMRQLAYQTIINTISKRHHNVS